MAKTDKVEKRVRKAKDGRVLEEKWFLNGRRHRARAPAHKKIDGRTGVVVSEFYLQNGRWHREGGKPALIMRDYLSGHETKLTWRWQNKLHREDGPARMYIDPTTGIVTHEQYFLFGRRHRDEGPAEIWRNSATGSVSRAFFYVADIRQEEQLYHEEEPYRVEFPVLDFAKI